MTRAKKSYHLELTKEQQALVLQKTGMEAKELEVTADEVKTRAEPKGVGDHGDRYSDIELARNAGVKSAFVLSGYGRGEWEYQRGNWTEQPDLVAEDLLEAVRLIVAE